MFSSGQQYGRVIKKFLSIEMKIISVLRHETAGKILTILHEELASHGKLA